jgi:hypothetical protein
VKRLFLYFAPLLLVAVAVGQMVVVARTPLSPWKLGGFGMYSGVDSVRARWIRLTLYTDEGELPVAFERMVAGQPTVARRARRVRALPTSRALAALGEDLLAGDAVFADCRPAGLPSWRARPGGSAVRLLAADQVEKLRCRPLEVARMRLEVWRYRYRAEGSRMVAEKISEAGAVAL